MTVDDDRTARGLARALPHLVLEDCTYACEMASQLASSGEHRCSCGAEARNLEQFIHALRRQ